jgi:hypothetical protein
MFVAPAVLLAVLRTLHPVDELKQQQQQQQQHQQNIEAWFGNVCGKHVLSAGWYSVSADSRGGDGYSATVS